MKDRIAATYVPRTIEVRRRTDDALGGWYLHTTGSMTTDGHRGMDVTVILRDELEKLGRFFKPGREMRVQLAALCGDTYRCTGIERDRSIEIITQADLARIDALRTTMFAGIAKALEQDGHCKSYEGRLTTGIEWPNYFVDGTTPPTAVIELHCYVLGPGRHHRLEAPSMAEALELAERDIQAWIKELEDEDADEAA